VEVRDLRRLPCRSRGWSGGQPDPGGAGEGGSSPDNAGTALTGRSCYLTGRFAPGTGGSSHPVARQLPLVRIVRS